MNRTWTRNYTIVLLVLWSVAAGTALGQTTNKSPFAAEIAAFAAMDKTNPPPRGAIVFTGSSSIRKWTNLVQDFKGHTVLNRGFGGSQISDAIFFADRIIITYQPKQVVFFAGSNDLDAGKTPERVFADFKTFVQKVQSALPNTEIDYLSITTSPSRWRQVEQVKKANGLISSWISGQPHLKFINVFPATLDAKGEPQPKFFLSDHLHMNAQGYALWQPLIEPYLQ